MAAALSLQEISHNLEATLLLVQMEGTATEIMGITNTGAPSNTLAVAASILRIILSPTGITVNGMIAKGTTKEEVITTTTTPTAAATTITTSQNTTMISIPRRPSAQSSRSPAKTTS